MPLSEGFELLVGAFPGFALDNLLEERLNSFTRLSERIVFLPEAHLSYTLLRACTYAARVECVLCVPPSLKS